MKPVILFREDNENERELVALKPYFEVHHLRSTVPDGCLVIGRYSVLPFYKELEADLDMNGSKLINTYHQHRYIADLGNWYQDLRHMTPRTWNRLELVPDDAFPIIIKGETNSKKFSWDTHMYAQNREKAIGVVSNLFEDGLIGDQQLYFRKFEKLETYFYGLRDIPVTKEFRVFVLDGEILSRGFYWSNYIDDIEQITKKTPDPYDVPDEFLDKVIARVGQKARFYVVDVAQKEDGEWIVIEINDGQMSGLSMTNPQQLYQNMQQVLLAGMGGKRARDLEG